MLVGPRLSSLQPYTPLGMAKGLLGKGALSSSSCKAAMIYVSMLQMKPALLLLTWPARDIGKVIDLWSGTAQSPIEKLHVGWWESMDTHREGGCPELLWIWNDNEWLFQSSWGWWYRALRPRVPGCLLYWCPGTSSFSWLCNKPLSLRWHFPNVLDHRTVFIFITQREHVSYKCNF